jgi:hypothetical protein
LVPHLAIAINLHFGVADPLNVWNQSEIMVGSSTAQDWIAHLGCMELERTAKGQSDRGIVESKLSQEGVPNDLRCKKALRI